MGASELSHELNPTQAAAVAQGVDLSELPQHIAIIMDGNGRWAQGRDMQRLLGHREGYRNLRKVLLTASELGIRYLTVYAFSAENWKRPEAEVGGLLKLIERAARDELQVMHKNNVRVRACGRINEVPTGLREALEECCKTTEANTGTTFILAINYGGRAEIVDAVKALILRHCSPDEITEESVSQALYNPDVPDPDLMIRTAGEQRWSNFLIWQAAYTELYVSASTWPEFSDMDLFDAVCEYQRRTRKFGGL